MRLQALLAALLMAGCAPAPDLPITAVATTSTPRPGATPTPSPTPTCGSEVDIDTAFAVATLDASIPTVASATIHVRAHQFIADPPEGTPFNANGEVSISDNTGTTLHGRVLHLELTTIDGAPRDNAADITGVLDCGAYFELEATDAGATNGIFGFGSHLNFVSFEGAIVVNPAPMLGLDPMLVPYSFVGAVPLSAATVYTHQNRPCISFLFNGFTHP